MDGNAETAIPAGAMIAPLHHDGRVIRSVEGEGFFYR